MIRMGFKWLYFGIFAALSGSVLWIYLIKPYSSRKRSSKRRIKADTKNSKESAELKSVVVDADILSLESAKLLTSLVESQSTLQMKQKALVTIAQKAAVFQNHKFLCESGCVKALSSLVQTFGSRSPEYWQQNPSDGHLLETALIAINNLANKEDNLPHIQDCIHPILVLALDEESCLPDKVRSAALKILINVTCTDSCFESFTEKDVQMLTDLLESQTSTDLRLHCLKLLANLSWNHYTGSFVMAAALPKSFFSDLDKNSAEEPLLRWLSILRNLTTTQRLFELNSSSYTPVSNAKKLTLRDILCDIDHRVFLQRKLLYLTSHFNDNISGLAVEISKTISQNPLSGRDSLLHSS